MDELDFGCAVEAGWARARGTSSRPAKAITTIVLPTLCISASPGLVWFPKYTGGSCKGANGRAGSTAESMISRGRASYGILQFIMRHTYLLIAILGVCLAAHGQA